MKVVSLLSVAPRFDCVLIRRQLGSLFSFSALIIPLRFATGSCRHYDRDDGREAE